MKDEGTEQDNWFSEGLINNPLDIMWRYNALGLLCLSRHISRDKGSTMIRPEDYIPLLQKIVVLLQRNVVFRRQT
jgi:hypothetical protein